MAKTIRAQSQSQQVKEIERQEWSLKVFRLSVTGLVVSLLFTMVGFGITIVLLTLLQGLISSVFTGGLEQNIQLVFGLLIFISILLFIAYALWISNRWISTHYILKSGSYKVIDDFVDQKPGAVIREIKGIFQSTSIYPVKDFERVEMRKGILASFFGYGHVTLIPKQDSPVSAVTARYLSDPEGFLFGAQQLIDSTLGANNQIAS